MLKLGLPNWFFVVFGYTVYAIMAGVTLQAFGGIGILFLVGFFVLTQCAYRMLKGRWCDWDEALK